MYCNFTAAASVRTLTNGMRNRRIKRNSRGDDTMGTKTVIGKVDQRRSILTRRHSPPGRGMPGIDFREKGITEGE